MRRIDALVLAALLSGACREHEPTHAALPHATGVVKVADELVASGRIKTTPVELRRARLELRVPGEVIPAAVGAAEAGALVAGRVVSVNVVEGDHVKRGQVLALVESPEAGRAVAELLRARARNTVASRKLERQRILERDHATSGDALDEAQAEATEAKAELAAAATVVRAVGAEDPGEEGEGARPVGARATVRAPLDGVVAHRDAMLGGAVTPDHALFKIVAEASNVVVARVPEALGGRGLFKDGAKVALAQRAADGSIQRCTGDVRGTLGALDPATRALPVRVWPDASCPPFRPGAFLDVLAAEDAPRETLVVPRAAVLDIKSLTGVFVAAPQGYVFRPITLEPSVGPDAIVLSGLQVGEQVVTDGALLLKGELLRVELEGAQ